MELETVDSKVGHALCDYKYINVTAHVIIYIHGTYLEKLGHRALHLSYV